MERSLIADPRLAGPGGKGHDVARGAQQAQGVEDSVGSKSRSGSSIKTWAGFIP